MKIKEIDHKLTWTIRHEVMWPDKPLDYIKLEDDSSGIHFGLYIENELVSVISAFTSSGETQFRKFATKMNHQGKGYGSALLEHLINYLVKNNTECVWCNARLEKTEFYKRFSLEETAHFFEKSKKKYVIMKRKL